MVLINQDFHPRHRFLSARRPLWPEPLEAAAATDPAPSARRVHVDLRDARGDQQQLMVFSKQRCGKPTISKWFSEGNHSHNRFNTRMFIYPTENEVGHWWNRTVCWLSENSNSWIRENCLADEDGLRGRDAFPPATHPKEQDKKALKIPLVFIVDLRTCNIWSIWNGERFWKAEFLVLLCMFHAGNVPHGNNWWGQRLTRSSDHQRILFHDMGVDQAHVRTLHKIGPY